MFTRELFEISKKFENFEKPQNLDKADIFYSNSEKHNEKKALKYYKLILKAAEKASLKGEYKYFHEQGINKNYLKFLKKMLRDSGFTVFDSCYRPRKSTKFLYFISINWNKSEPETLTSKF